jgi:hypothetical protein
MSLSVLQISPFILHAPDQHAVVFYGKKDVLLSIFTHTQPNQQQPVFVDGKIMLRIEEWKFIFGFMI